MRGASVRQAGRIIDIISARTGPARAGIPTGLITNIISAASAAQSRTSRRNFHRPEADLPVDNHIYGWNLGGRNWKPPEHGGAYTSPVP